MKPYLLSAHTKKGFFKVEFYKLIYANTYTEAFDKLNVYIIQIGYKTEDFVIINETIE